MAANNRGRLKPALPEDYFGNMITTLKADAKAGELVERGLGWSAWKLHETVMNNTNEKIRESLEEWTQCPYTYQFVQRRDGSEFGMGKLVGVRSGYGNVYCYPGSEGGASIDLEIFLLPQTMAVLESDFELVGCHFFRCYKSRSALHHYEITKVIMYFNSNLALKFYSTFVT